MVGLRHKKEPSHGTRSGYLANRKHQTLYLVAMPNPVTEVTKSAIEAISSADLVICEDRKFFDRFILENKIQVSGQLIEFIDNHKLASDTAIRFLEDGKSVALMSDDGFPCIVDHGRGVVDYALYMNTKIKIVPNVSSIVNAYILSGYSHVPFIFMGIIDKHYLDKRNLESFEDYVFIYLTSLKHRDLVKQILLAKHGPNAKVSLIWDYGYDKHKIINTTIEDIDLHVAGNLLTVVVLPKK
jgi:16S rRNA (cytidine1402-2'-O)-methyltransferase